MVVVPAVALIGLDMIRDAVHSARARYWLPAYLGIQVAIAYVFAQHLAIRSRVQHHTQRWRTALVMVLGIGLASCITCSQATLWWHKAEANQNWPVAQRINQVQHPLVVSVPFLYDCCPSAIY